MEHSAFPSDETLAAFIDGRLDEETRTRVVAHVADCEDCYGTVMASRPFQATEETPATVSHPRSWKALWISSGSIAAAAVIALVIFAGPLREWYEQYSYNRRTHIGTLLDAANHLPYRPSDARVSGENTYRPPATVVRGSAKKDDLQPVGLLAAAATVEEETQSSPPLIKLHAAGVSSLLLGRIDAAVDQLDQAVRQNLDTPLVTAIHLSNDARLLNDLAAAHYTRFKQRASAEDLLISHEAVARAWSLRPDVSTAWNRALVLQASELHDAAIEAWRDYLTLDSTSRWADEARGQLKVLTSGKESSSSAIDGARLREIAQSGHQEELLAVARSRPQDVRAFCEETVFTGWARAFLANDKVAAQEELATAQRLASVIHQVSGDDLDADTVTRIEREQASAGGRAMAEAIAALADGRALSRQHQTNDALQKLNSASATLRSLSCPLWLRAQVFVGTADFYLGRYSRSADEIHAIREGIGTSISRYPSVIAQAEWIHGLIEATANHPFEAVHAYRVASSRFETTGERDNAAFLQGLTSEALNLAGNRTEAWNSAMEALRAGRGYSTPRHLALINAAIGRAALNAGYIASADEYARAALIRDLRNVDPPFVADALMLRGRILNRLGAPARAKLCWEAADNIAAKLPDEALRHRMRADVEFARASASGGPAEELDQSIDSCRRKGDQFRLARLSFVRARRDAEQAAVSAAIVDYDAAINALSRVDAVDIGSLRTWRDGMRESLDDAIRFAIRSGRDGDALRWLLLIQTRGPVSHPPTSQTAVVAYWALSDRVCAWVIGPSSIYFHAEPLSRASLALLASTARQDQGSASQLYDKLLRPIESRVRHSTSLVILADEFFTSVPFSALYDRQRSEYVVQRFDVRLARTMALSPARIATRSWTPLIVADPAFDTAILPNLPRLGGAIQEAKAVSGSFNGSKILTGTEATIGALKQAASRFDVLHIAAHAISGDGPLASSAVVLATDATQSGLLYAADIRPETFGHLHLVVMSTCRSAADTNGGISDIAEAFLSAGVPTVIGSLSDVDDSQSAQFYKDFYHSLASTKDPAIAFRLAQLNDSKRRSSAWTNYVLFTGCWPSITSWRPEIRNATSRGRSYPSSAVDRRKH